VELQDEYGEEGFVVLYYHVSDPYSTPETHARAGYYQVGGIPEVDFDGATEVIGAGSNVYNVYEPIVSARYATPSPISLRTEGIIRQHDAPDSSWVTTVFTATDTVTSGDLRVYFIVYENTSIAYPATVRDMLPAITVSTLSAPGDSVVITRKFVVDDSWDFDELKVAVLIEDTDPVETINAQVMPDPFANEMGHSNLYAMEIDYGGESAYETVLRNTGVLRDTITIDIAHDILPAGLGPFDWVPFFKDGYGVPHYTAWECVLEPGERETLEVHVLDTIGTTRGMALTSLTATSNGDATVVSSESFATFVDLPSILLVDGDGGASHETYLEAALNDTGYSAMVWDVDENGTPTLTRMNSYWAVLWTTANGDAQDIGGAEENNMAAYLDQGGNLMLSSMEFLSSRVNTLAFISDYLHIDSWAADIGGFIVAGQTDDHISDGMSLNLLGGPFAPNPSDVFVTTHQSVVPFFTTPAGVEGIRVEEDGHRLVFMSFPFEDVKIAEPDPDNQKTLVARVIDWFGSETGVDETETHRLTLAQNHPNPFNPVTEVAFTVPSGAGRVTLTIYDVGGRVVRTLVDGELPAGPAKVVWDGTGDSGQSLASGVYFAKLATGEQSAYRKMTLLK